MRDFEGEQRILKDKYTLKMAAIGEMFYHAALKQDKIRKVVSEVEQYMVEYEQLNAMINLAAELKMERQLASPDVQFLPDEVECEDLNRDKLMRVDEALLNYHSKFDSFDSDWQKNSGEHYLELIREIIK